MQKHWKRDLKRKVWERDNYTCRYCGLYMLPGYILWLEGRSKRKNALITVDHVIPVSKGGLLTFENLVTACRGCNAEKGSKEPFSMIKLEDISEFSPT